MFNMSKKLRWILIFITVVFFFGGGVSKSIEGPEAIKPENKKDTIEKTESIQEEKKVNQEKSSITPEQIVLKLISSIKSGRKIGDLMSDKIEFIYHSDNRCDGSTDGVIDDLPGNSIDDTIKVQVTNNGEGWACEKKKATTYQLDIKLDEYLKHWDRFESSSYNEESNSIDLHGSGESDYIILGFKKVRGRYLINKLEYRSEDPG